MSRLLRMFVVLAATASGSQHALAADRVALVVGNSAYKNQSVLSNPVNDAADVSDMFRRMGFEVVVGLDLDGTGFKAKLKEFRDKLDERSLAVFYYSGHGIQVDGQNYMIPVDAKVDKAEDVRLETVEMDLVLQVMRGPERVSVIVLDACRDNPFTRSLRRGAKTGTRAAESAYGGLAEIRSSVGSVIVYATDPGNVALDGDGRNSPFTEAFLKNAPQPGMEISRLIKRVRYDVVQATGSRQVPWDSSTLINDVYLAGELPLATLASTGDAASAAGQLGAQGGTSGPTVAMRSPAETATRSAPTVTGPGPVAPAKPDASAAAQCDRLAGDVQDTLRNKAYPPVRTVDTARATEICETAVAESPRELRLANQLGRSYLKAERYQDALRVFKDAAGRGSPYATNEVGYLYYRGFGGAKKDYAQARPWFEKAAQLGVPVSMSNLAYMYSHGIGVERDLQKAATWLRKGEALADPGSIVSLAELYLEGLGVAKDEAKARELMMRAADMEYPEAMTQLGLLAQLGRAGPQDFDAARDWFEKAASFDAASGMYNLGFYHLMGMGGAPRDYALARDWFNRSLRHDGTDALIALAHMDINGLGGPVDLDAARAALDKAISHDNSAAMLYLSHAYRDGNFGTPDPKAAREWLERAASLDDPGARKELTDADRTRSKGETCDWLAAIATDPLRPKDVPAVASVNPALAIPACEAAMKEAPATLRFANQLGYAHVQAERWGDAMRVFSAAAQKKSAFAALWVGNLHGRGLGVPTDKVAARKWYEQGATLGSSDAMFNLAVAFADGIGGPKDLTKARQLYERAAALGHVSAMRELGDIYYFGTGVPEDNSTARDWFQKAAAGDDVVAKRRLGEIYVKGHGVKPDVPTARLWLQRAAGDGDADAMRMLADIYLNGIGGKREPRKALGYLEQASDAGSSRAMSTLAQLLLGGVAGEVDEPLARRWYEKAAAGGDAAAKAWLAAHVPGQPADRSQGDLCDRLAGSDADPLRSVEFSAAERVDTKAAVPACEAAYAAFPETLRYANQLGRTYIAASRDVDAARVFRKAAEEGSAFAGLWMGNLYSRGQAGFETSNDIAAQWWEKAADAGSPNAMHNLGIMWIDRYNDNIDKDKSAAQARRWFGRAAEIGEPDAMLQMALIHRDGIGGKPDKGAFLEWLRKSAQFGSGDAMRMLASRLYNGEDGAADIAGARDMLERAIAAGSDESLSNLAMFLIEGYGGPKDLPRARKLLEQGAGKQNVRAIYDLANALEQGIFGKPDKAEARRYYRLAADLGDERARTALGRLK